MQPVNNPEKNNDTTYRRRSCAVSACRRWPWMLGLLFALFTQPVWSEASNALEPAANSFVQPTRGSGRIIGLNQAIRIAQEESGGQVLSAKSVQRPNGVLYHRVRVLVDDQRVMTMVVDQNGRLRRGR